MPGSFEETMSAFSNGVFTARCEAVDDEGNAILPLIDSFEGIEDATRAGGDADGKIDDAGESAMVDGPRTRAVLAKRFNT